MKWQTIFRAYEAAQAHCENERAVRGFVFGIAVEKDEHALHWQHYNRQRRTFRARLMNKLARCDIAEGRR